MSPGVRDIYDLLSSRQIGHADVEFVQTLHEPEHGGLEFSVRDPNGFTLRFLQETQAAAAPSQGADLRTQETR